ncbi:MAG TPA: hypothetical protein VMT99_02260 [Candidatus Paceibacterota bacterium]|nr:hypothetical protein [Candidatus Paceibacterota bacterium]
MEDRTYKQVAAVILSILILGVAYYGSYRPMRKAQGFISTLQSLQTNPVSTLSELEARVSGPLNYASPIGQEELVRNLANSVLGFVQQQGGNATSTNDLIGFLNTYYDPILARGKGMSFGQDLYLEGAVNEIAFVSTGNPTFLSAAQHWYQEGESLGPNRPQPLYGLFDVYRASGNVSDTIAIGTKILTNWPSDTRVAQSLEQFLIPQSSSTKKTGTTSGAKK